MSTATPFVAIGSFPYCPTNVGYGQTISIQANKYYDAQWIGPMSITSAMSIYWNLESATFSINGRTITVEDEYQVYTPSASFPIYPTPNERVCFPNDWYGEADFGSGEDGSCEIRSDIGVDPSSGSYYVGVVAAYYSGSLSSSPGHMTSFGINAPSADWTAAATYSGTVFGFAVTWYRFWFVDYYPTYSGTDNASVGGSFYSY